MESISFVLSTAQVAVRVACVLKKHLESFSNFEQLARSVKSKSIHSRAAAKQISALTGILGISCLTYQRTHRSLRKICDILTSIQQRVASCFSKHLPLKKSFAAQMKCSTKSNSTCAKFRCYLDSISFRYVEFGGNPQGTQ